MKKPHSGDIEIIARFMSPLRGFGIVWSVFRGLAHPG